MKIRKLILLAILSLVALFSCKKDTDPNVATFKIVKETEKVIVGTTEVTISGTYEYPGKINSIKVRIGTEAQLFGSDLYATEVSGKAYSVHVTGLRSGTEYHYRYEVDYGAKEDFLSEISDFTTQSESPTVKTLEVLALDSTTFRIKCEVLSGGGQEVTERGICWNTYGDPTLDDETMQYVSGGIGQYTIRVENLATNTAYYVRAYAKSAAGIGFGEELNFRTGGSTTTPQVSTVEISNITYNAAQCLGNISSDGGLSITERGVCWGLEPDPTINVHHAVADGTEIGNFTVAIEGLLPNTTYHARCYATNEKGTAYGEELTFKTTEGKPTVTTSGITEITSTSAKGGGEVTDQGASVVTERGICWSTNHEPVATGNHVANGTGAGSYTCNITNLTPNETYYVRAYATNNQGTAYGAEVEFTAKEGMPVVVTFNVTDITATSAKAHGKVTDQGGSTVSERGICWGTEPSPTIDGSHACSGTGVGEFEISMTNLSPGTTYYVRAYAKNTQGLTYGEQKDFRTEATLPTVTTGNINGMTVSGNVTNDGGATVTERGICWSATNNEPTVADTHASNGTGTGSYAVELTDLEPGTTYYVRAYATNEKGTAYGVVKSLTTEANSPTVTTGEVTNIGQNSAQGSGNVTSNGGANVTERGVCWSTSHNPTVDGSHNTSGTGTGSFTVNMTGLMANTKYYVRAYAKNSAGKIGYGAEVDFTTSQNVSAPMVTTAQVTNIQQTTASGGGNVTSDGGASVTERGICWSTSHNPTTNGSHASNGSGTGTFTVNMTGLTAGTTYYVRAYAINSQGASYGSEVSFTTLSGGGNPPTGAINGLFTINANGDQVYFSKGNLQYIGSASTSYWKFADNQWDVLGTNTGQNSYSKYVDRDLFGWGTSNYNHGAVCYQPWSTNRTNSYYYAYGQPTYNLYDQTGQADWGYNAISNGGGQTGQWRTLTGGINGEWGYVFNTRSTTSGIRYAKAQVNGVCGVILLPDNWNANTYSLSNTNQYNASFSSNVISASQWNTLQNAGAVFLPAAGSRDGTSVSNVGYYGVYGVYWSASCDGGDWACEVSFSDSYIYPLSGSDRYYGRSVRLVAPAE
jgi:hypothetical protein